MNKKAQGISMNVIIIAALALLVLVVLSVVFLGRMGIWGPQVDDCVNKGGTCQNTVNSDCSTETDGAYPTALPMYRCDEEGYTCCGNVGQ